MPLPFSFPQLAAPDEMIHPREPILGYAKGAPIFPRSHVHVCLTPDQWLRQEARVVVPITDAAGGGEAAAGVPGLLPAGASQGDLNSEGISSMSVRGRLPPPALWARPRASRQGPRGASSHSTAPASGAAAAPADASATLALYGIWQTAPFVPPPHTAGTPLPRNAHGNLELWGGNQAFLPQGLDWIPLKSARAAAVSLGIESVDVVVSVAICRIRRVCRGCVVSGALAHYT